MIAVDVIKLVVGIHYLIYILVDWSRVNVTTELFNKWHRMNSKPMPQNSYT